MQIRLKFTLVSILVSTICLFAQSSSQFLGQVTDNTGAVVPKAKITVENTATGIKREAETDNQGKYSVPNLPPGNYRVSTEASGFQIMVRNDVQLPVAAALTIDFKLEVGQITQTIEVQAAGTAVDTNTANGTYMGSKQLVDLPINGRDYARFSLLTPGAVARSNYISDMSFNGLHSVMNNFSIDGVDASRVDQPYMANGYERGARLLTGSLDTMDEFRVQTSNYKAEFGKAAGTMVTVVSKSGSNEFHGSLFEFLRNDFFDARNFFNTKPTRMAPFRYNNFGGNLGGPLVKGKTFFFANYEGSRQRVGIVGSGTVPSAALRQRVLAASPELKSILDQFPVGQSPTSSPDLDNYSRSDVSKVREDTGSIRVDHNFSDTQRIYARFNLNDTETAGPLFGVTASALGVNDFQQVPITTTNGVINYSKIFSPRLIMELSAGVQRWGSQINSELPYPQVNITGIGVVPGSRRFSRTNSQSNQFGGNMTWVRGAHTVKFGATYWRAGVNVLSRDLLTLTYNSIANFVENNLTQAVVAKGDPGSGRRQNWVGSYIQDTWQVRRNLTIDYGLRYDIGTPNEGNRDIYRAFDTRTMTLGAPGAQWYAMNKKNFAPRIGISYQPFERLVIRTGYGIFYQQYPPGNGYSVAANTITGNTTLLATQVPGLSYPVDPFLSSPSAALPNLEGFNWNKPELYTQQWNFTVLGQITKSTALQVAYVGNRGINLRREYNINFINPATRARPIPQYANILVEYNSGQSTYHAFQTSLSTKFSRGLQGTFNYTFAKAIDNTQDYGLYSTQPQDSNCANGCERGLSSGDIKHSVNYQFLYDLPFGKDGRFFTNAHGFAGHLISGWQLSSLALVRSGIATTAYIGTNTSGTSNFTNQRPNAVQGVDPYATNQTINNWFNSAAFSMPASGTFGNVGRGTLRGPDFWQFDASLSKQTRLTERVVALFRAEAYNLLNRPNFDMPNTTYGTANFGRIFNTFGRTMGFGTSRQIQLSFRLRF